MFTLLCNELLMVSQYILIFHLSDDRDSNQTGLVIQFPNGDKVNKCQLSIITTSLPNIMQSTGIQILNKLNILTLYLILLCN